MQQHLIFGAGLIGCYLGGVMHKQGLNVALFCRSHVKRKLSKGLTLTDYLSHQTHIQALELIEASGEQNPEALENHCHYLWLTVKCTAVESVVIELQPFITDDTIILCCQNGLGSEAIVQQAFANNKVLKVMVPFNVVESAPGHFHRGSEGSLTIQHDPQVEYLVQDLNCEFLPITTSGDMTALMWAKLQLNLGNGVNALADIPVKAMLQHRHYRLVIALLMDELILVARANNITLPKLTAVKPQWLPKVLRLPSWLFKVVANKMLAIDPTVRTSMWWDLTNNKPTEVDYLNGAVVEVGQSLGVACPKNLRLVRLIHQVESGQMKQGISGTALLNLITTDDVELSSHESD